MDAVRNGYVVVAPDYIGLASPTMHPFLVGPVTANAVLDAVRAAREIPGAAAGSNFAVWGESQGGHAALWTATAARSYEPDLALVATAAAAPPTDLAANLGEGSDKNARALLLSFALHSCSALYGFSQDSRSEEHTSELQSLMRISYAVFCLKKKIHSHTHLTMQIHTQPL